MILILFLILYFVIFSYFLGSFFYVYRTRILFFNEVLSSIKNSINFIDNFKYVLFNKKKQNIKLICFRR